MTVPTDAPGPSFVVDLIGDLDATLGHIVHTTFADLRARGATAIYLTTKRVAVTSVEGMRALEAALAVARAAGVIVGLDAGSRKMRAAFVEARIPVTQSVAPPAATRTLLIAHHAVAKPATRSLAALPLSA